MIRIDAMFSDHMVLQRGKNIPIWGTGNDGETVTVECRDKQAKAVVEGGRWKVLLPSMDAGGPFELTVKSGEAQKIALRDVWFGDVWLAGGQSNMEWSLNDSAEGPAELPKANFEQLRYYQVPKITYEDGIEREPSWVVCTPETARAFSAVAYFFAQRVMEEEGVPIGIIGCNWGGTSAACWMDEQVLERDPALHVYLEEHRERLVDFSWEKFYEQERAHEKAIQDFFERAERGLTGEELGDYPWMPPYSPHSYMRPSGLYHTMLSKAAPYALRGFLYYQGEADADHKAPLYDRLLEGLIGNWRRDWEDPELPFLFVQLPVYENGDPDGEHWPLLREAQWKTARRVRGAWMTAAWELGEKTDIHPRHKQPVGERLALLALEHVYGRSGVVSSGPVWEDVRFDRGEAVLRFRHAGSDGLGIRGGGALKGFELCGPDNLYGPAEAEIRSGDTVVVRSSQVADPVAVRYGWANYSEANLVGSTGLPALPFRTRE
ncbi:sialate O-acetylesterase [Cohnella sp. CFH 77786]|uniref:sialate O-acetylesterase n=1 Tax=Cohnella sp. CFH 77786 TaxID=2662265 RepID=UPI001C6083F8|nr:sialate O-acetylesterase [Cohnella sp. CFH 77786]MBW5448052.1 sialate O-acetylesterase [Cohnella sp. CFH 77786]